ncbi:MAG: DUF58 domain-containing protein [Acidobacteria bacterium]|nr:DUF58 domain-containing protein [Acidobacteriota bacterium]
MGLLPPELAQKIKLFEIHSRKLIVSGFAGEYRSVFRGQGMEFDEVRPYAPGDDVRLIDWNVSARTGELYIKKHIEEREQTVLLVVDLSKSGDFTSATRTKREIAAEICCILGFAASTNNDRVGLLLFTDQVEKYVPPQKGLQHALRIVRDLLLTEPHSPKTNISNALSYLNKILRRPAIIFLVSDFLDKNFERALKITSHRHEIVAIELTDLREKLLPKVGLIEIKDSETGETLLLDSNSKLFQENFKRIIEEEKSFLRKLFAQLSIDHINLTTNQAYEASLRKLFAMRSKRLIR